jgi:hypothetical protein
MTTVTKTEWYMILSVEFSKHSWYTREMNEQQFSEWSSNKRTELKRMYKIINN